MAGIVVMMFVVIILVVFYAQYGSDSASWNISISMIALIITKMSVTKMMHKQIKKKT